MNKYEVIVGADAQSLVIQFTDINTGSVIDLTGAANFYLDGVSDDLPSVTIHHTGSLKNGPAGLVEFSGIGSTDPSTGYIELTDLGALPEATFTCEVSVTNASKKFYSPRFQITWKAPLYIPPPP